MSMVKKRDLMEVCNAVIPKMSDEHLIRLGMLMLGIMNEMADRDGIDRCEGCYYNTTNDKEHHAPCSVCDKSQRWSKGIDTGNETLIVAEKTYDLIDEQLNTNIGNQANDEYNEEFLNQEPNWSRLDGK